MKKYLSLLLLCLSACTPKQTDYLQWMYESMPLPDSLN